MRIKQDNTWHKIPEENKRPVSFHFCDTHVHSASPVHPFSLPPPPLSLSPKHSRQGSGHSPAGANLTNFVMVITSVVMVFQQGAYGLLASVLLHRWPHSGYTYLAASLSANPCCHPGDPEGGSLG